jgi:hypothetical protein
MRRSALRAEAHDTVSRRSSREHRAQQADALTIGAQAKRRLADEYDAAQARGEIATRLDNLRPALFGSRANAARRNSTTTSKPERQASQSFDLDQACPSGYPSLQVSPLRPGSTGLLSWTGENPIGTGSTRGRMRLQSICAETSDTS